MVTHVVTWLLHYCGFVSHKQLVTTNFFNLHFDFVTCHKQLYHAYWVTPAYNSVPLPKYIRRQGTKTLICCLSAVAKITICLCCTTPESVFCCFGAGKFWYFDLEHFCRSHVPPNEAVMEKYKRLTHGSRSPSLLYKVGIVMTHDIKVFCMHPVGSNTGQLSLFTDWRQKHFSCLSYKWIQ